MVPVHEITKSLPPSREDEPASLRQNIVDEILDHLQCSLRRELLVHGSDEATAKNRVLNKFGDPSQIARKLWFQAMWSKIMVQRLMIGSMICVMAVSIALVAMVGWLIHQQQQTNTALLEQLTRLIPPANSSQGPRDPRWNNLKIRVTRGTQDGPALEGADVVVAKLPGIGEVANPHGTEHSTKIDQSGMADCGYVEPGIYQATVTTSWHEATQVKFTVHPGSDHLEQIVAPENPPAITHASFQVTGMPQMPSNSYTAIVIEFDRIGSREIAGRHWKKADAASMIGESLPFLLLVPNHGVWVSQVPSEIPGRRFEASVFNGGPQNWGLDYGQVAARANWTRLDENQQFTLPEGQYAVRFGVARLMGNESTSNVGQVHVSGDLYSPNGAEIPRSGHYISDTRPYSSGNPIANPIPREVNPLHSEWRNYVSFHLPQAAVASLPSEFVADPARLNEWTIPLPANVIEFLSTDSINPMGIPSYYPAVTTPSIEETPNNEGTQPKGQPPVPTPSDDESSDADDDIPGQRLQKRLRNRTPVPVDEKGVAPQLVPTPDDDAQPEPVKSPVDSPR